MEPSDLSREDLEAAKRYMRVDGTEDDPVVTSCVCAARSYMTQAGVSLPPQGTPRRAQYDLVCYAQALSFYDRRDPTITGGGVSDNPVLTRMLNQLKLTEPAATAAEEG